MATYRQFMDAPLENLTLLRRLRDAAPSEIVISYDEWNMWAAWFRKSCAIEGMYTARMLHVMLASAYQLLTPVMCYFQPVSEGAISVFRDRAELTADGQAFSLLKAHKGGQLCVVEGDRDFDTLATVRDEVLTVSLINRAFDEPAIFHLDEPGEVLDARLLTARDLLPGSRFREEDLAAVSGPDGIRMELPPRSVALLRVKRMK